LNAEARGETPQNSKRPRDEKVTFKITAKQHEWAEDEEYRLKRSGRGKVTQSELFDLMPEAV
jgi:hypothetical protein